MTATLHVIYIHGHEYLRWAQEVVGVPLGALAESAMECHNADKKRAKTGHARMTSLEHQSVDTLDSTMWKSCPLVNSFIEIIQKIKRGYMIRRARARAI